MSSTLQWVLTQPRPVGSGPFTSHTGPVTVPEPVGAPERESRRAGRVRVSSSFGMTTRASLPGAPQYGRFRIAAAP